MTYLYDYPYRNGYTYYNQYLPWRDSQNYINRDAGTEKARMSLDGIGTVKVLPDIAVMILGVITESKELSIAQQQNAEIMQYVIDNLAGIGVDKKDIETEAYLIVPQYDYIEGKQVFNGYRVTNNLKVTLRNTEEVGKVIDTAVASGANVVNNVNFTLSDPSNVYKIALSQAIMDAVKKAISIEKTLNIIVDKTPIDISEESTDRSLVREMDKLMSSTASTPIMGGEIEVVARIKAIFSYREI